VLTPLGDLTWNDPLRSYSQCTARWPHFLSCHSCTRGVLHGKLFSFLPAACLLDMLWTCKEEYLIRKPCRCCLLCAVQGVDREDVLELNHSGSFLILDWICSSEWLLDIKEPSNISPFPDDIYLGCISACQLMHYSGLFCWFQLEKKHHRQQYNSSLVLYSNMICKQ